MTRSSVTLDALRNCLAIEHEAMWLYAFIGARIDALDRRARTSYNAHRRNRDALIARLLAVTLPGPRSDYAVSQIKTATQGEALAQAIEVKCQSAYLAVIGSGGTSDRKFAVTRLRCAALAGLDWDAEPAAFPGLPN